MGSRVMSLKKLSDLMPINGTSTRSAKGPGCPSDYDAGLTNQTSTSLVRLPSLLNFS